MYHSAKFLIKQFFELVKGYSQCLTFNSGLLLKDGTDKIRDFRGAWNKACQEVNLGHRLFHDFRRDAVSDMVRFGVPERLAMMISGHKTRSGFERCNIVSTDDLRQAAAKQEAYLENLDQQNHGYKMVTMDFFTKKMT
jgi:integrase